jgi:hypothetical protein
VSTQHYNAMAKNGGSGFPSLPRSKYTAWRSVTGQAMNFRRLTRSRPRRVEQRRRHREAKHPPSLGVDPQFGLVFLLLRALDGRRARLTQEPQGRLAAAVAEINTAEPGTVACSRTLTSARRTRSLCREVANRRLSRQGERLRSPDNSHKIATGEPSIPEARGNVLGARAARRTRGCSAFENYRENEPDMTTYPLEFHRRSEQKWAHRVQASSAWESTSLAASAGSMRRATRNLVTSSARRPWLQAIGQWRRVEYTAVEQPVPERLAVLLKQLKGRRR